MNHFLRGRSPRCLIVPAKATCIPSIISLFTNLLKWPSGMPIYGTKSWNSHRSEKCNMKFRGSVNFIGAGVDTTATTDTTGTYIFAHVADGTYVIALSKTGYTFKQSNIQAAVNGANLTVSDLTGRKYGAWPAGWSWMGICLPWREAIYVWYGWQDDQY